jgi:ketosteroid isomerase-like protein
VDVAEAVLAANRRYYEAFEAADFDAMSDLWERSERVVCTHPGWATLRGWAAVGASFVALFQGRQWIQFVLTEERMNISGDVAWVSLDENLLGDQGGVTVATINVFSRTEGRDQWQMVCHHGSVVHNPG